MITADLLPGGDNGARDRSSPGDLARHQSAPAGLDTAGGGILADLPSPVSFTLPTPPSVNELYKNVKGVGRVKAGLYDDFIRRGVASIRLQGVAPLTGYVVAVFGVERMSITADIDNRLKSMLDTIVKAGVIEDDRFVTAIAVSWLPRANGMAHVRLYPVQQLDLTFHPSQNGASGGWFQNAPLTQGEDDDGYQPIGS